jgi:hypothetical protein
MKQSSYAWSRAHAQQAQADLDARDVLLNAEVPACQHLHFLQMACEKLSKAHRCLGGADPETLMHSHGFAAKVLPQIARELLRRAAFAADLEVAAGRIEPMIRQLAREVDLLAPAVDDDGRRPENCEYPWEDDEGALHVPAEHGFGPLGTLHRHRAGATFLKIVTTAAAELGGGSYATS